MGNAAGELGNFEAALKIAERIGNGLAMFHRDQPRQLLAMGIGKLEELHHDPAAELRVLGGPGRLRSFRIFDSSCHFSC